MNNALVLGSRLELRGHTDSVFDIAFSPDGRRIVSCSGDRTIRVWDLETGGIILGPLTQTGGDCVFTSVTFSPDGTQIASGSTHGEVTIWDVHTGKTYARLLTGHADLVWWVAFSPDGKLVASTSDGKIVWETLSGRKILDQVGNYRYPAFSPDGKHLLCMREQIITVWDVQAARAALRISWRRLQSLFGVFC